MGGELFTYLQSVNDAGDYCGNTPSAAFVNIGGTTTTINVPGADGTGAYGINNLDQVVGIYLQEVTSSAIVETLTTRSNTHLQCLAC